MLTVKHLRSREICPKVPEAKKRPADVIGAAVKVMRIATVEEADEPESVERRCGAGEVWRRRASQKSEGRAAGGNCTEGGGEAMEESLIGCAVIVLASGSPQVDIERQVHWEVDAFILGTDTIPMFPYRRLAVAHRPPSALDA